MKGKVLVISPHPDDETLGAGGTILKYKDSKHRVYWLNITSIKKEYGFTEKKVQMRKKEIEKVISRYNFDGFFNLQLKPAGLDIYPLSFIIEKVSEVIMKVKPKAVFLPYKYDIHSDHRIVFECTFACTKIFRFEFIKKVFAMEVISETNFSTPHEYFSPNYFVDISDYLNEKIAIKKIYKRDLGNHPFPRSSENIKALATIRGSQAGCKYAEGFMVLKEID